MSDYEPVLQTRDLGPGKVASVRAHGRDLVLANVGQTYYALDARCPNEGTNLGRSGELRDYLLVCPTDQWAYDVRTGERVRPSAGPPLRRYDIRVEDNAVLVGPPVGGNGAGG